MLLYQTTTAMMDKDNNLCNIMILEYYIIFYIQQGENISEYSSANYRYETDKGCYGSL